MLISTIILEAYRKLGFGLHETLSTEESSAGLTALGVLLQDQVTEELTYWTESTTSIAYSSFVSNKATITSSISTLATEPIKVLAARRISADSTERIPVQLVGREQFMQWTPYVSTASAPTQVYTKVNISTAGVSTIDVYVWPAAGTYSIELDVQKQNTIPTATSDSLVLPAHWNRAIIFDLASDLAPSMGVGVEERALLEKQRDKRVEAATDFDSEGRSLFIQPQNDY